MPQTIITNQRYNKTLLIDLNSQYTNVPTQPLQLTDVAAVSNFIFNVLFTSPGEVPFEPQFGSGIAASTFDNMTATNSIRLIHEAYFSVQKWIPYVTINRAASYVSSNSLNAENTFVIVYSIDNLPGEFVATRTLSTQQ